MNASHNNSSTTKYRKIDDNTRKLIIERVIIDGERLIDVAKSFKLSKSTVHGIIKIFKESGRSEKVQIRGKPPKKIKSDHSDFIERILENNPTLTLKEIASRCFNEHDINVSISTVQKHLESLKITLKRNSLLLDRVNDSTRLALRKEYARNFQTYSPVEDSKKIFVDECGFNLHLRRGQGRSRLGIRVSTVVPTIRGRNLTLLAAMNNERIIFFKVFQGACNSEKFIEFLGELDMVLVNRYAITDGCIYMDNARPHTSEVTRTGIIELQNRVEYLSPYSYMLNPIEFAFGKIKNSIRNKLADDIEHLLADLINESISEVTSADCAGFFRLMHRNINLALRDHKFE